MPVKIKIVNTSSNPLPVYETTQSAGMDLRADLHEADSIAAGERKLISTGLFIELPEGYEAQIRPRSGLALKHGVTVLNSPGTIDADYRGEIKVLLINHGSDAFPLNHGDRIAQMIISRCGQAEWEAVKELGETKRGTGGYGHTGKN